MNFREAVDRFITNSDESEYTRECPRCGRICDCEDKYCPSCHKVMKR